MNDENIGCTLLAVIMLIFVIGGLVINSFTCSARWGDFETSWGPIKGCTVKQGGKFYPENRVRSVE